GVRTNTTSIEAICSTSPPEYKTGKAGVRALKLPGAISYNTITRQSTNVTSPSLGINNRRFCKPMHNLQRLDPNERNAVFKSNNNILFCVQRKDKLKLFSVLEVEGVLNVKVEIKSEQEEQTDSSDIEHEHFQLSAKQNLSKKIHHFVESLWQSVRATSDAVKNCIKTIDIDEQITHNL
ncbi:hypothetical protein L9F63_014677, partial [Diploptera punctata]